jgi:hypothetical protein
MPDWILMGVFESRMEASLCLNEMWQELDHAKRAEAVTEEIFV